MSISGAQLETKADLSVGDPLTVRLDADEPTAWLVGHIAWAKDADGDGSTRYGVHWQTISASAREPLEEFLRAMMSRSATRRALRKTVDKAAPYMLEARELFVLTEGRRRKVRELAVVFGFALVCTVLGMGMQLGGALSGLELRSLDARQRIVPPRPLHEKIEIISIDDATLRQLGWPLPRAVHAQILDVLNQARAAAVMYDIIFAEASPFGAEQDTAFAQIAAQSGCVLFPSTFRLDSHGGAFSKHVTVADQPIATLKLQTKMTAHLHVSPSADGIFRALPPVLVGREVVPALAIAGYTCLLRHDDVAGALRFDAGASRLQIVDSAERTVEVNLDSQGLSWMFFPSGYHDLRIVSALDFLQGYKRAHDSGREAAFLQKYSGKMVLVGQTARSFGDWGPTPRDALAPLVAVHAAYLDNLLNDAFVHRSPTWFNALALVLLAGGIFFASRRWRSWRGTLVGLSLVMGYAALTAVVFVVAHLWLDLAATTCTGVVMAVGLLTAQSFLGERHDRLVRDAFGAFVSPEILTRIMENPQELDVGGHRCKISILFSDIKGYTHLSNTKSAQEVLRILREYLAEMSRIILSHNGTIDKIMGDGIMCFFGDPIPRADYAEAAAQAALDMQFSMDDLKRRWSEQGLPSLEIRIGIATGEVYVGNVGARDHLEYTAIGTAVNLASRLESKAPPGGILVCRDTAGRIQERYLCEESAGVELKGYSETYRPYLLKGRRV